MLDLPQLKKVCRKFGELSSTSESTGGIILFRSAQIGIRFGS